MRQKIVNGSVFQMRRADRITAAPLSQDSGQDRVEIAPVFGDLVLAEDAKSAHVAVTVEGCDLGGSEPLRVCVLARVKVQIALDPAQFFARWDDLESG